MGGEQEPLAPPLVFSVGTSKGHEGECLNISGHQGSGGT